MGHRKVLYSRWQTFQAAPTNNSHVMGYLCNKWVCANTRVGLKCVACGGVYVHGRGGGSHPFGTGMECVNEVGISYLLLTSEPNITPP